METKLPAIVLIEMDEVTLDLYRRELCRSFEVLAFNHLDGVLDVIVSRDVQAVIIEPEIASGQGWQLINTLAAAFPDHPLSVIVCTTRDKRNEQIPESVIRYLTKPVLPKVLKETALEVIKGK